MVVNELPRDLMCPVRRRGYGHDSSLVIRGQHVCDHCLGPVAIRVVNGYQVWAELFLIREEEELW